MDDNLTTEEHIKRLYEQIEQTTKTMHKMLTAFLGSQEYGTRGYRHRIEQNEEAIDHHEKRMNKMDERFKTIYQRVMGIAVGVTIAALAIGWMVVNVRNDAHGSPIPKVERIYTPHLSSPIEPKELEAMPEDSSNAR